MERILPDGPNADALSLRELEQLRERIRGSVVRTHDELERIETLIVTAALREQRRAQSYGFDVDHQLGPGPPTGPP